MQVWKIFLLNPTKDWGRFVKEKAVFIGKFGPEELSEVSKFSCEEDMEEYLSEGAAAQLWNFSNGIKQGDIVVATAAKSILGVGKIAGAYTYEPIYDVEEECYHKSHIRRAKWIEFSPHLTPAAGDPLFKPIPKEFEALNNQAKIVKLTQREWELVGKKYPRIREACQKLGSD